MDQGSSYSVTFKQSGQAKKTEEVNLRYPIFSIFHKLGSWKVRYFDRPASRNHQVPKNCPILVVKKQSRV